MTSADLPYWALGVSIVALVFTSINASVCAQRIVGLGGVAGRNPEVCGFLISPMNSKVQLPEKLINRREDGYLEQSAPPYSARA